MYYGEREKEEKEENVKKYAGRRTTFIILQGMKMDIRKEWMLNSGDFLKHSQELTLYPVLCATVLSRNCT